MPVSKVMIGNMALDHIGAGSNIESFDENSAEAKAIKLWYDHARKVTLEAYDWNFASKRLTLATHIDAAPDGIWCFRYQYPADCINARELENPSGPDGDAVPFEVEPSIDGTDKSILTNLDDAVLRYTFDQELTSMFTTAFVDALSYQIAHRIAFTLSGKLSIKQDMLANFNQTILFASASAANERVPDEPRDSDWIRGRA